MKHRLSEEELAVTKQIGQWKKQTNQMSFFRLLTFVIAFCCFMLGFFDKKTGAGVAGILFTLAFCVFVVLFQKRNAQLSYALAKQEVIQEDLARLGIKWKDFDDTGEEFLKIAAEKEIAADLDLFGKASLFQFMNVAASKGGRQKLAAWLMAALGKEQTPLSFEEITLRQEAVLELQQKYAYSQELKTISKLFAKHNKKMDIVLSVEENDISKNKKEGIGFGVLAVGFLLAAYGTLILALLGHCSYVVPGVIFVVQFVVTQALDGIVAAKSGSAFSLIQYLCAYQPFLVAIQKGEVTSRMLVSIKEEIGQDAEKGIASLKTIKEALLIRHNPLVYGLLCGLFSYNLFLYLAYTRWNDRYAERINVWLDAVALMEALLSLSVIGQLKETSCMPKLFECKEPKISLTQMKHPLLAEEAMVDNDALLEGELRVITGSNMSGKTTYLRCVGVNLVLAYAGACVCASQAKLSMMRLFTSMRIKDDMSEGVSTFYAEVLRIKHMVDYSRTGQPMLALIDEIFKGTNSADRIVGAKGVLTALLKDWVIAMVSTHDFELCNMEENPRVVNYHFDEYFEDEKLKFEYRLKKGPCTTTNALHILKMAGI